MYLSGSSSHLGVELESMVEIGSTRGARGMLGEPSVDTLDVERVPAFRQHPHLLPILEIAQTNGAL